MTAAATTIARRRLPVSSLCLLLLVVVVAPASVVAATTVYGNGALKRGVGPLAATPEGGVVAIVSSPSNDSDFFDAGTDSVDADVDADAGCVVVTAPGATLRGTSDLDKGAGAGAAASVAGAVVLTGLVAADASSDEDGGVAETRHGRTLRSVFATRLSSTAATESDDKTLLLLAVEGEELSEDDTARLASDVRQIFDTCAMTADHTDETEDVSMSDLYELRIMTVNSREDAAEVMAAAVEAGGRSPLARSSSDVVSGVSASLAECARALPTSYASPAAAARRALCEDALARHSRAARAVLSSWRSRALGRELLVDGFGARATALLERVVEAYDADTLEACGSPHRAEARAALRDPIEKTVRELFDAQVESAGQRTLRRFNNALLRRHKRGGDDDDADAEYDDNAADVRAAAFAFDTAVSDLEVPALSLRKTRYCATMSNTLNEALRAFPTSAAVQLADLKTVRKSASKEKKPTERSIEAGLSLVAMIRPDGFGNLQGYAGYTRGNKSLIVGLHNDADAPETISQFGGSRPPLLRVQPKLKLDVEL